MSRHGDRFTKYKTLFTSIYVSLQNPWKKILYVIVGTKVFFHVIFLLSGHIFFGQEELSTDCQAVYKSVIFKRTNDVYDHRAIYYYISLADRGLNTPNSCFPDIIHLLFGLALYVQRVVQHGQEYGTAYVLNALTWGRICQS